MERLNSKFVSNLDYFKIHADEITERENNVTQDEYCRLGKHLPSEDDLKYSCSKYHHCTNCREIFCMTKDEREKFKRLYKSTKTWKDGWFYNFIFDSTRVGC